MADGLVRLWRTLFGEPPPVAGDAALLSCILVESLPPAPPYRLGPTPISKHAPAPSDPRR